MSIWSKWLAGFAEKPNLTQTANDNATVVGAFAAALEQEDLRGLTTSQRTSLSKRRRKEDTIRVDLSRSLTWAEIESVLIGAERVRPLEEYISFDCLAYVEPTPVMWFVFGWELTMEESRDFFSELASYLNENLVNVHPVGVRSHWK